MAKHPVPIKQCVSVYSLRAPALTLERNILISFRPFTPSISITITVNVNAGGKNEIGSGPIQSGNGYVDTDAFAQSNRSSIRSLVNPKTRIPFIN